MTLLSSRTGHRDKWESDREIPLISPCLAFLFYNNYIVTEELRPQNIQIGKWWGLTC